MIRIINKLDNIQEDSDSIFICNSLDYLDIDLSDRNIYTIKSKPYIIYYKTRNILICKDLDDLTFDVLHSEILNKVKTIDYVVGGIFNIKNKRFCDFDEIDVIDYLYSLKELIVYPVEKDLLDSITDEYEIFSKTHKLSLCGNAIIDFPNLYKDGKFIINIFQKYFINPNLFSYIDNRGNTSINFLLKSKGYCLDITLNNLGKIKYIFTIPNEVVPNSSFYPIKYAVYATYKFKGITTGKIDIDNFEEIVKEYLIKMNLI